MIVIDLTSSGIEEVNCVSKLSHGNMNIELVTGSKNIGATLCKYRGARSARLLKITAQANLMYNGTICCMYVCNVAQPERR